MKNCFFSAVVVVVVVLVNLVHQVAFAGMDETIEYARQNPGKSVVFVDRNHTGDIVTGSVTVETKEYREQQEQEKKEFEEWCNNNKGIVTTVEVGVGIPAVIGIICFSFFTTLVILVGCGTARKVLPWFGDIWCYFVEYATVAIVVLCGSWSAMCATGDIASWACGLAFTSALAAIGSYYFYVKGLLG